MSDAQIIRDLPALKWRGLAAPPYEVVTAKWKNRLSPRAVAYVDTEVHDDTGRDSFVMTARLLFINTLFNTTGFRLFPDYWEQWKPLLISGQAGDLVHPVLGLVRARIEDGGLEVRGTSTAGIVVDVSWTETNEDPSTVAFLGELYANPETLARAADAICATFGVHFPTGRHEGSLYEAFKALKGSLFALEASAAAAVRSYESAIDSMMDALGLQDDPATLPATDMLAALSSAVIDQFTAVLKLARSTGQRVVRQETTLDAFASSVGNTVQEVMGLNPDALRQPSVPRGTTLTFYTS